MHCTWQSILQSYRIADYIEGTVCSALFCVPRVWDVAHMCVKLMSLRGWCTGEPHAYVTREWVVVDLVFQGRRRGRSREGQERQPSQGASEALRRSVSGHLHFLVACVVRALLRARASRRGRALRVGKGGHSCERNGREGGHVCIGLCGAQGAVARSISAHSGAHAHCGLLVWEEAK